MSFLIRLVSMCMLFALVSCAPHARPAADRQEALVLLGQHDFSTQGLITLDGIWEMYRGRLLSPADFSSTAHAPRIDTLVALPMVWNELRFNGQKMGPYGSATFRLRIVLHDRSHLAIKMLTANCAYALYADGEFLGGNGTPGNTAESTIPDYRPQILEFTPRSDTVEIVYQVANFSDAKGGPWKSVVLGSEVDVRRARDMRSLLELFLIGAILLFSAHSFIISVLWGFDRSFLYFSATCAAVAVKLGFNDERFINRLLPAVPFDWLLRTEYAVFYMIPAFFLAFIASQYPRSFNRVLVAGGLFLAAIMCILVSFIPQQLYSLTVLPYEFFCLAVFAYILYGVGRALGRGESGALAILIGLGMLLPTVINDIMYDNNIIQTVSMLPAGMLCFMLMQAVFLSKRTLDQYTKIEELSTDLADSNIALRLTEARYRNIVEKSSDIIFTCDPAGRITFISGGVSHLGVEASSLTGIPFVNIVTPEDRPAAAAAIRTALSGTASSAVIRIGRKGDEDWYYESVMQKIGGEEGLPPQVSGILRDVSEREKMEAALRHAKEIAIAASSAKSSFVANMSHEIRTPLNGVVGLLDLISHTPLDAEQTELVKNAQLASESLLHVVGDILDFSRIEAAHIELDIRPFSLRDLFAEMRTVFVPRFSDKGLSFSVDIPGDFPAAQNGDYARLRQVLINLLGNALKFTDAGGVSLKAAILPGRPERFTVSVSDTGVGIDAASLELLFTPFYQGDNSNTRRHGGTGLGLSICAGLLRCMDGGIQVKSLVGSGTMFLCELPLMPPLSPASASVFASMPSSRPLKILLVEDNLTNQMVLRKLLEKDGHRCDLAENGQLAVDAVALETYDIILMDCQMPVMDGFDAAKKIRDLQGFALRTPIIAVTANAQAETHARCLASGMNDYLTKPVRAEVLRNMIAKHAA